MSTQPEALRHAEWLGLSLAIGAQEAAAELRRLHEVEVAYGVMMAKAESRIAEQARRILALYTAPQPAQQQKCQYAKDVAMPEFRCVDKCQYAQQPPQFPTMLRKMWSGAEVQQWINENWSKT